MNLQNLFGENIPCKMKAEVDLKAIEAIMLTVDEEAVKKFLQTSLQFGDKKMVYFTELLTKELVQKYKN